MKEDGLERQEKERRRKREEAISEKRPARTRGDVEIMEQSVVEASLIIGI